MEQLDQVLSHPTTLRLFIYLKNNGKEEIGVRDAQRSLGFSSPSTIIWHLDKLSQAGLVIKTPNNKYKLDRLGQEYNELKIPVTHSLYFFRGYFFPSMVFVISLLIFGLISTLVLWLIQAGSTAMFLNSFAIMLVTIAMMTREWRTIQNQLADFYPENNL